MRGITIPNGGVPVHDDRLLKDVKREAAIKVKTRREKLVLIRSRK
jgi:hypothetical protein